jgi:hypothetical protein
MTWLRLLFFLPLVLMSPPASAETADGSGALALAALVGQNSPKLDPAAKDLLLKLLDGDTKTASSTGTILVKADKINCRASNVDITAHFCEFAFGGTTAKISGRKAHELYATLAEIGVLPDGAAGSSFEAIAQLNCKVDVTAVKQITGGGARCDYAPAD